MYCRIQIIWEYIHNNSFDKHYNILTFTDILLTAL